MDSYTKKAWGFANSKLGELADMIPIVAKQVKMAVDTEDGEQIRQRGIEIKEAAAALDNVGVKNR